jgi:predicted molibdopterin-dependent oxidoreductase YjgC
MLRLRAGVGVAQLEEAARIICEAERPSITSGMNPLDMKFDGLADGDRVEIASQYGRVIATAKADQTMRQGVVSVPHLWGSIDSKVDPSFASGCHIGHLVSPSEHRQSINFMPRQSGIPVTVRIEKQ